MKCRHWPTAMPTCSRARGWLRSSASSSPCPTDPTTWGAVRHPQDRRRRSHGQPGPQARRHPIFLRLQSRRRGAGRRGRAEAFRTAAASATHTPTLLVVGGAEWKSRLAAAPDTWQNFPTHPDDPAIWLFSGGTTGRPKAAVQPHRSFVNTASVTAARCSAIPRTMSPSRCPSSTSATRGIQPLLPFSAGATSVLFDERCTADAIFGRIARFRPTILITVPTMINQMVSHPEAGRPGPLVAAPGHLGRRGIARGAPHQMGPGLRGTAARRPRHRGAVAHLPLQ